MTVSKDPSKPTTKDLSSHMPDGFPAYNASMNAGNTITNKPPGVPEMPSEATASAEGRDTVDIIAHAYKTKPREVGAGTPPSLPSSPRTWKET